MAQSFTTDVTQWQGVDKEPVEWSNNLIESKAAFNIQKQIDVNVSNEELIDTGSVTANGIIPQNSGYEVNGNMSTDYIFVKAGYHIKVTSTSGSYTGFTTEKPARNVVPTWYNAFPNSASIIAYDFVFETDGYLGIARSNNADATVFKIVNNGLNKRLTTVEGKVSTLESCQEELVNDVSDIEKQISKAAQIVVDSTRVDNIMADSTNKYEANSNMCTEYVFIPAGTHISVQDAGSYAGFSANVPARNVAISSYWNNKSTIESTDFVFESDGYLGVSRLKTAYAVKFYTPNKGIYPRLNNLESSVAQNTSDIQDLEEDFTLVDADYNLTTDDIQLSIAQSYGIMADSTRKYEPAASFVTDYIPVKKGYEYLINQSNGYKIAFSDVVPARNVAITGYQSGASSGAFQNYRFIAPIDGYFGISRPSSNNPSQIKLVNNGMLKRLGNLDGNGVSEYEICFPSYIFGKSGSKIAERVRVENLVDREVNFSINNSREYFLQGSGTQYVNTTSNSIKLDANGIEKGNKNANYVTINPAVIQEQLIKYLAIGDSWCANNSQVNMRGEDDDVWNYISEACSELKKTWMDLDDSVGNVVSLGMMATKTKQLTYQGQTYLVNARNEGRGGWSAQAYLRHPVGVRETGAGDISGKAAWDACGLGRKQVYGGTYDESATYAPFVDDVAHIKEYLQTAMGYYHWDYSTELMNWCHITGTYSGTSEQKAAIDTYMENVLNNPQNYFYDWATAISSEGAYAFHFAKYLERYKTREEDGITKLILNQTAGTKITSQSQIDNYAVCTPTHVTVELGMNDYRQLTSQERADDIEQIATLIHSYDNSIKVGICQVHCTGTFNPEKWADLGWFTKMDTYVFKSLFGLNKELCSRYDNLSNQSGIYYVPTYFTQGCEKSGAIYKNLVNGREVLVDGTDAIHASLDVYKEIGYQIYCWILYTFAS